MVLLLKTPDSSDALHTLQNVRSARDILTRSRGEIERDLAPEKKAKGLAALENLDRSLTEFQDIIDAKDKQQVPLKQREALTYVGLIEEAMVAGFPFEVPKEYASRPLLLVGGVEFGFVEALMRCVGSLM